ncbi:MAG TPA: hypothetical protein VNO87_10405 [Methylomirabilota bacterium]|nr:hypothetical protein [Methylomirabilota bacterium]
MVIMTGARQSIATTGAFSRSSGRRCTGRIEEEERAKEQAVDDRGANIRGGARSVWAAKSLRHRPHEKAIEDPD